MHQKSNKKYLLFKRRTLILLLGFIVCFLQSNAYHLPSKAFSENKKQVEHFTKYQKVTSGSLPTLPNKNKDNEEDEKFYETDNDDDSINTFQGVFSFSYKTNFEDIKLVKFLYRQSISGSPPFYILFHSWKIYC